MFATLSLVMYCLFGMNRRERDWGTFNFPPCKKNMNILISIESSASCPSMLQISAYKNKKGKELEVTHYEELIFGSEQRFLGFLVARVIYAHNLGYDVFT